MDEKPRGSCSRSELRGDSGEGIPVWWVGERPAAARSAQQTLRLEAAVTFATEPAGMPALLWAEPCVGRKARPTAAWVCAAGAGAVGGVYDTGNSLYSSYSLYSQRSGDWGRDGGERERRDLDKQIIQL